jgi:hypothetical protein
LLSGELLPQKNFNSTIPIAIGRATSAKKLQLYHPDCYRETYFRKKTSTLPSRLLSGELLPQKNFNSTIPIAIGRATSAKKL